ncbi:T9SS type A sorting domain-containing protein [candidate division WOR-3 bacterium]|nr:T9SS type A sorting domain-containing protein [candidate division WOR-3 bacterium]
MGRHLSLILIIISFIIPESAFSWIKRYGEDGSDRGYAMDLTEDGGFVVAGRTTSFGANEGDFYLLRCDEDGDTLWTRIYGGILEERAYAVRETSDGGYILAGFTYSFNPEDNCNVYLVKTDVSGDTLWTRSYGGVNKDSANCIYEISGGGYIVVGSTTSFGAGEGDIWVLRLNESGDTIWTRTYGDIYNDEGSWVVETPDAGFIVVGSKESTETNYGEVYIFKIDGNGNIIWDKTYERILGGMAECIIPTADGNYIVTGFTYTHDIWGDVYLAKFAPSGDSLWSNSYGGNSKDRGFSVCELAEGGYIITGNTLSYGKGQEDIYLIKTDAFGEELWARTYGDALLDETHEVYETSDGGYLLAGRTRSWGSVRCDVLIIKTDNEGNPAISEKQKITTPLAVYLYPNPFNELISIVYYLPEVSNVKIDIYDPLGRKMNTLIDRLENTGSHTISWDATDYDRNPLPAGVYFLGFRYDEFFVKRRMILLR